MSSQIQQHQVQLAVAAITAAAIAGISLLVMYRWRRGKAKKKPAPHAAAPPPLELDEVDVVLPPRARNILPEVVVEDADDTEDEEERQEEAAPEADAGEAPEAEAVVDDKETQEEVERQLEGVLRRGKAAFRAQNWDVAAKHYTEAIALLDQLPDDANRRASLYNNRAAMHEKAGRLEASLDDCVEALRMQRGHKLARSRKIRIFVQLDRFEDALAEMCATMFCERERFQEALAMGRQEEPPQEPEAFNAVLQQKAQHDADEAMAARRARPPRMAPGRSTTYEVLTSFQSYADLKTRYGGASPAAATDAVSAAAAAVDAAGGSGGGGGSSSSSGSAAAVGGWVRALHSRSMAYLVARDLGRAIVDLDCAAALLLAAPVPAEAEAEADSPPEKAAPGSSPSLAEAIIAVKEAQEAIAASDEPVALDLAATAAVTALAALGAPAPVTNGTPPRAAAASAAATGGGSPSTAAADAKLAAAVLAWSATFLHLRHDLTAAAAIYERAAELETPQTHPDVWIKLASLRLDVEDHEGAAEYLERAIEADPSYSTSYLYRAQMHMGSAAAALAADPPEVMQAHAKQAAAKDDLHKCLQLCPDNIQAYMRLVGLHLQSDEQQEARATLDDGIRRFPNSADLLTAKGEFVYGLAIAAQQENPEDGAVAEQCMRDLAEALVFFDRAMAADPSNPAPVVNKAIALMQVHNDIAGCSELLEKALEADPNHQVSLLHMGQMKMMTSANVEEAEAAVGYFDRAMKCSHERDQLFQLAVMRATAKGKAQGARLLGLTQLG